MKTPTGLEIEVKWGGEWVVPKDWKAANGKRTVFALLNTRQGIWKWVKFKNYLFSDKSWRYFSRQTA